MKKESRGQDSGICQTYNHGQIVKNLPTIIFHKADNVSAKNSQNSILRECFM